MRGGIPQRRIELLRSLPLFAGCSNKDLNRVDRFLDDIEVPAGEVLTREGEVGQQAFVVVEGEATVSLRGQHLAILGPGACFGEMALVELEPRSATVVAAGPMRLLVLGRQQFSSLLAEGNLAVKLLRSVAGRLREVNLSFAEEAS